jgi:TRAP-type transport system periplasmic protein
MKKILVLSLAVILVISLFLAACASSTPAPSTTKPAAPATSVAPASSAAPSSAPPKPSAPASSALAAPAAAGKVIELRFSYQSSVTADATIMAVEPWARMVEKATNNQIKITSYPASTLAAMPNNFDAVATGVADIGWIFIGMMPGRFPLTEIAGLPYLYDNATVATMSMQNLYDTIPEYKAEYSAVKYLFATSEPSTPVAARAKKLQKLEDLSGMKFRVPGGPPTNWFKAAGAVALNLPAPDIFENLQKGVIDGFTMPIHAATDYKLETITKYYTDVRFNNSQLIIAMNLNKYNSLPDVVKIAIDSVSGVTGAKFFGEAMDKAGDHAWQVTQTAGAEKIPLSTEERARWVALNAPIQKDFVAGVNAKGLPGTKVMDTITKFVASYK